MKTRTLALIAGVSVGLFGLALVDPWQQHSAVVRDRLLSPGQMASITKLVLVEPSGSELSLQKAGEGDWTLLGAEETPLDSNAVRELVSVVGLLRSSRQGPRVSASLPAEGAHSIHLEWKGGSESFAFGARTADGKHQWVLAGDKGPALLVESYLVEQALDLGGRLVSAKLFAQRPSSGTRIELRDGDKWVRVEGGKVGWQGRRPDQLVPADPVRVDQLRDALADLEFLEALPASADCDRERPWLLVGQGSDVTQVHGCTPCSKNRIGLSVGTRSGCVDSSSWSQVRSLLEDPTTLIDRRVLPTRSAQSAFTLSCDPGKLDVVPGKVDDKRLQEWWRSLDTAARTVSEGAAPIALCTLRGAEVEVSFGMQESKWVAFTPAAPGLLWHLDPPAESLLRARATDFLSLHLIEEEPLSATRIVIVERRKSAVLQRGELVDAWEMTPDSEGQSQGASQLEVTQWALRLRFTLSTLRAVGFADVDSPPPNPQTTRRITIDYLLPTSEGTKSYELLVAPAKNRKQSEGLCWVQVNSQSPAWVSPETCEALLANAK